MAWEPPQKTVMVCSKEYTVDPERMPYFNTQDNSNNDDLKHFDVALECVEEGPHAAFGFFKTDVSSYPVLCATLKRLGVDVLRGRSLAEVIEGFKSFRWDDEESKEESTNLAEDSVFGLLYMHHTGALGLKDRDKVFNAIIYIISHRYLFHHYTRSAVRETYRTMMNPTVKQLAAIDKWPVYDSNGKPLDPYIASDDDDDYYYGDSGDDDYY